MRDDGPTQPHGGRRDAAPATGGGADGAPRAEVEWVDGGRAASQRRPRWWRRARCRGSAPPSWRRSP